MPIVTLYIQPGAKQSRLVGTHDGMLKIAIKARPIDGEANKALIAFLSDHCQLPKQSFQIVAGESSRIKRVEMPEQAFMLLTSLRTI